MLFPWAGLVFAGAFVGVLIDAARDSDRERHVNVWLGGGGLVLVAAGYAASFVPSPFAGDSFWTSSPAYFVMRVGIVMTAVAIAYAWLTSLGPRQWSPIIQLGRNSLFVYWVHMELIYGVVSRSLHGSLSLRQASTAFLLFTGLMLAASVLKDRLVQRYLRRPYGTAAVAAYHGSGEETLHDGLRMTS